MERERYVAHFAAARAEASLETVSELLISVNADHLPYPYRYLRVDLIARTPDGQNISEVKLDLDPNFQPAGFDFGGIIVEVHPFTWNAVQIVVNQPISNIKQLEGWITRWLDVEDKNVDEVSGLSLAVHSFTPVESQGDWSFLTGDFGTAPTDTLTEFVELMIGQGITHIIIRSGEATT